MFKTIEAQGGRGGPEWLSSHPNPGNRYNAINREAAIAARDGQRRTPGRVPGGQGAADGHVAGLTAEQIAQGQGRTAAGRRPAAARRCAWSRRRRSTASYSPRSSCASRVPVQLEPDRRRAGRRDLRAGGRLRRGGQGEPRSRTASRSASPRAAAATCSATPKRCSRASRRSNPQLRRAGNYQRTTIGGRTRASRRRCAMSRRSRERGVRQRVHGATCRTATCCS